MFAAKPEEALSTDNKHPPARVSSGAVRSLKDTFSGVEKDYQELREKLAGGTVAIEIDPATVDPSPLADRFSDGDPQSFELLKQSIAERGQEIPILVREHPSEPGRYQSAYGHRRVRVLRELGRPVKAYVKILTDEDLVVAQGIENSAREDLSFIERAVFAMRLEEGGFKRAVVQAALSIDRAEASKLVAVGRVFRPTLSKRLDEPLRLAAAAGSRSSTTCNKREQLNALELRSTRIGRKPKPVMSDLHWPCQQRRKRNSPMEALAKPSLREAAAETRSAD